MRNARPTRPAAVAGVAGLLLGGTLMAAVPASAVPQTIVYDCQAGTILGPIATTFDSVTEATAPETVPAGSPFQVRITPQPDTVPTESNGNQLAAIRNVSFTIPVPANSTLTAARLSGGSGLPSEPQLVVGADEVTISLQGDLAGGAAYQLPELTLDLVAGAEGTITVQVGGTSYTDPGLTLTALIRLFGQTIEAPTSCFPSPNPVLSTTTITPVTPPVEPTDPPVEPTDPPVDPAPQG